MPAIASHWLFARDALRRFSCPPAFKTQTPLVCLGSQGPDPFFFYGRIPWKRRPIAPDGIRAFASACHAQDPKFWLQALVHALPRQEEPLRTKAAALVYGFFLHYQLDRTVHPYVFSKSGFDEEGELSPPWDARHAWFETLLDLSWLAERGVRMHDISPWCMLNVPSLDLELMSSFLYRAFPDSLAEQSYRHACTDMGTVFRVVHDSSGWKRRLALRSRLRDSLMTAFIAPRVLSPGERERVLGLDRAPWPDPVHGTMRDEPFITLYERALDGLESLNALWHELEKGIMSPALESWLSGINHDGSLPGDRRSYRVQ